MISMLIGSTLSALATGLGALPILFIRNLTHRLKDAILAFTAGVMLSASFFGLIPQALEVSNIVTVSIGLLFGTFIMNYLERKIPHIDLKHNHGLMNIDNKSLLIIAALTLHNIPEGMATGLSYAYEDNSSLGPLIALSIASQNAPEGLLIALYLINQNITNWKAVGIATLTGSIEIVAAVIGYSSASYISNLVPYGLSFAAGAMIFIVAKELLPETQADGNSRSSTYSLVLGIVTMLFLIGLT